MQLASTNTTTDSEILKKKSHVQQSPYYLIIFTGTRSSSMPLQCLMYDTLKCTPTRY